MSFSRRNRFAKALRLSLAIGAASLMAACSTEFERFADYPPVKQTGSVSKGTATGTPPVSSRPLANSGSPQSRPSWQNAYSSQGSSSAPQSTGLVVVRPGQTLFSIARANGTTVPRLASANNISSPYAVNVGQRIRVPGVANPQSPAPTFQPISRVQAASAPVPTRNFASGGVHQVRPGETLFSLGRAYNMHPYKIAEHNRLARPYGLRVGQRLRIPGKNAYTPGERPVAPPKYQVTKRHPDPMATPQAPPVERLPSTAGNDSTFRWPVRGRVISSYGTKPNGTRNEGINIAVPKGASIRSAESGVVAYAGNELKGYGNLVLVRHQNGWVTAYAHNSELFVKRGDAVKRGEVIAKAGSTGSVNTPQLHFELRKGASAVNPMKYLSSRSAAY